MWCMHLEGERICEALATSACPLFVFTFYKTFTASLIAFRVVAKGMAAMAGFHATP